MLLAFLASGALGMLVEWALIRHLYKRPLDTLLATWGLSLILQQTFRSMFGAREVGVELPQWLLGSLKVTETIDIPINGVFVMGLTLLITVAVACVMFKSRWGRQVRAVVQNRMMSGAVGINTEKVDRSRSRSAAASRASPAAPSPRLARPGRHRASSTSWIPSWWWSSAAPPACSAPSPPPSASRRRSRRWNFS